MMSMMHSQINRAISTAIASKVIPEIQNIVRSMSSSRNRDTEDSVPPNSQKNRECSSGFKSKFAKKELTVHVWFEIHHMLWSIHGDRSYRHPTSNSRIPDRTNPLNPQLGDATIKPQGLSGHDSTSPRTRGTWYPTGPIEQIGRRFGQFAQQTPINDYQTSSNHTNDVWRKKQKNWTFRGFVPHDDQNATGYDRTDEN